MKKAAPKRTDQKIKKENGYRKTQTERKQKCAINPSALQDIETNGVKGVDKAVQSRKKSTGLKGMDEGVGSTSGIGTSATNTCQKRGVVTGGSTKATKLNPPPQPASAIGGRNDKRQSRNKRTESESEEEELLSTAGSSEEVTEEEISEEEEHDSVKESSKGESSEEGTESSGVQRNTEETAIKRPDQGISGESRRSRRSELDTLASSIEEEEEETRVELSFPGLKDETQGKEIRQEDPSERLTGCRTRRRRGQPSRPTKPAKESRYKMYKRSKAEKQAEKEEKCRLKAEKQRLEKEAKQKAKEEKKNKKKAPKAEKRASVTKEIRAMGSSRGKFRKTNRKAAKPTKNPEEEENAGMSEVSREEDDEDEPALTKASKGQNRLLHLKEKGKDFRNILAKPEEEMSEGQPLVLESNQVRQRLIAQRKGASTFHRVSGWIQKNVPHNFNLRNKLSAWTKAVGISRWLSFKAIKQNRSPKKSERGIARHRMALRVASKTRLVSKNKVAKEKAGEAGGAVVPCGEKDSEAKYAVVLPRMNELSKAKTGEASQATPANRAESPGESSSGSRPPKAGARLVLPVKPDFSLLKSIKMSLPVDFAAGAGSSQRPEGSLKMGESNIKAALEEDGVLQAARGKLDPCPIHRTKLALSGGTQGPEPEREAAAGMPKSNFQAFPNGEPGSRVTDAGPICDEETDREVAQLMCDGEKYAVHPPEVHWAGNPQMSGDPQVRSIRFSGCNAFLVFRTHVGSTICLCLVKDWLRAENLLPHQTVEKLSNWTVYGDGGQAETAPAYNARGPWVSEDPTQEMLESRLSSTQVLIISLQIV